MSRYDFIDRIFGDDEEEQTDDESTEDDDEESDDDDDSDDATAAEDEDDDELPVEDAAGLLRLDRAYRILRAKVIASTDLSELRSLRFDQTTALAGRLTPTTRLRINDIVEAIDDRVTSVRAALMRRGS